LKTHIIALLVFFSTALILPSLLLLSAEPVSAQDPDPIWDYDSPRQLPPPVVLPPLRARVPSLLSGTFFAYLPLISVYPVTSFGDMVFVPAGTFVMGCNPADEVETHCGGSYFNGFLMETPLHSVYLSDYYIDKYKVTNARYSACVTASACSPPAYNWSQTRIDYYTNPAYANFPVLNVDWFNARALCQWEGKRLATEAEWEKAVRGSLDTRRYPWGDTRPDCTLDNFRMPGYGLCVGDTTAVDSFSMINQSPYGLISASGNAWEWVSDWYQDDYYSYSPYYNPTGPANAVTSLSCNYCRVVRGGSWAFTWTYNRTSYRGRLDPFSTTTYTGSPDIDVGFRCAR
jgi:formylglycine-generating enzyme required for sulfatase activity